MKTLLVGFDDKMLKSKGMQYLGRDFEMVPDCIRAIMNLATYSPDQIVINLNACNDARVNTLVDEFGNSNRPEYFRGSFFAIRTDSRHVDDLTCLDRLDVNAYEEGAGRDDALAAIFTPAEEPAAV